MKVATTNKGGTRAAARATRYRRHNKSTASGVSAADTGTKRFHSPASTAASGNVPPCASAAVGGWSLPANHERAQPVRRNRNPLNPVGRLDALDHCLFAQYIQHFGFPPQPQVVLTASLHACAKEPAGSDGDCHRGQTIRVQRQHPVAQ